MVLPVLPTDEEFRTLKTFPLNEGRHVEFKSSIQCGKHKVLPTLCGFLNVGGGHMIFGVADDLAINGFTATTKELDSFLLFVDNIVRNGHLMKENNDPILPGQIACRVINLDDGRRVIVITATSAEVTRYQLKDGIIYYRLNASNYRVTNEKYYTDAQVSMMMRDRATLIHREYHGLLVGMEKEIKRSYDEVEVLETKLATARGELTAARGELTAARGELTAVSTILGQRILKEKAIKEEAIARRVGCQSSCLGWICTTVF